MGEDEAQEAQFELEQALDMQKVLHQDLQQKAAVIRELLRRSGLTANPTGSFQRLMSKANAAFSGSSPGMDDASAVEPALRLGELERALERALSEVAELRGAPPGAATSGSISTASRQPFR